jgi:major membrane immunogen (membrane-anchored lipoprotein)
MKNAIITGVIAASILLAGCGKKNGSHGSPASPTNAQADAASSSPATQPVLATQETQKPLSDVELFQKVTGVWKYTNTHRIFDTTTENTLTLAPNGNYANQAVSIHGTERKNSTIFGTWQVKDGVLTTTLTKIDPMPRDGLGGVIAKGFLGFISQRKIVSVNDHELVLEIDVYTITGNGGHSKTKGTRKLTR